MHGRSDLTLLVMFFCDSYWRQVSVLQFDTGAQEGEMGIRPDRMASDLVYGAVPIVRASERID